jgi:hypothetical protein
MKPSQSSIYRETERLLELSIETVERLPKSASWNVIGKRTINNIMDCLDFTVLALQAKEGQQRLEMIDAIIVRMTAVKMAYRQMVNLRKVSTKQYGRFLDLLNSIATQLGAWQNKQRQIAKVAEKENS